jgi:type IV secretion system protein VirB1
MKCVTSFFLCSILLFGQNRAATIRTAQACVSSEAVSTILAIVQVESHHQPYAVSVNAPAKTALRFGYSSGTVRLQRQPQSLAEATGWIRWFRANHLTISIGLMQVNVEELPFIHLTDEDLLDPCRNLQAGWQIFQGHYARAEQQFGRGQKALRAAISAYNSGSFRLGFENGYVGKVLRAAD